MALNVSRTPLALRTPESRPIRLRRQLAVVTGVAATVGMVILVAVVGMPTASAAESPVGLGEATSFAVLAGTTVTNTGPSLISGDLGVNPGSEITGFPPGQVINGTEHAADAVALRAQSALTTGYDDAAGRTPATTVSSDLGGQTLAPGVYKTASALGLTGTVTLDAEGDPNAVFIFQAGSTLITAPGSTVALIGGAQACNVFWQVGSSATLGTRTTFVGSILALTSASLDTGTTVMGRVLARNGAVNLDSNTITMSTCSTGPTPTPTPTPSPTASPSPNAPTGDVPVIPKGHPETGAGGTSSSGGNSAFLPLGILALGGAGLATSQAVRRRRVLPARDGLGRKDLDRSE